MMGDPSLLSVWVPLKQGSKHMGYAVRLFGRHPFLLRSPEQLEDAGSTMR